MAGSVVLFHAVGCGGKSDSTNSSSHDPPDGAPPMIDCQTGRISGEIEGTPIESTGTVLGGSGSYIEGHWWVDWLITPFGTAFAWGAGTRGDEVDGSAIFATPRSAPFDGAVYEAKVSFLLGSEGSKPVRFSELRRIGHCPGLALTGDLTFCPGSKGCSTAPPPDGFASLVGTLSGESIDERAKITLGVAIGPGRLIGLDEGGLVAIDRTAESWGGVIAFPLASQQKELVCIDSVAAPPTQEGVFRTTTLSFAGLQPGEPIAGWFVINSCNQRP